MRFMGIVVSILLVGALVALGLPAWANGRHDVAIGMAALCVLGLGLTLAAYGPWREAFHSHWDAFKSKIKPYLLAGFCLFAAASATHTAFSSIALKSCSVADGARHAFMRSLFQSVCDHYGYKVFAAVNLALIPLCFWLGIVLWRATTRGRSD